MLPYLLLLGNLFVIVFFVKRFNKVFDQDCKQDEVFEDVAQGVIDK